MHMFSIHNGHVSWEALINSTVCFALPPYVDEIQVVELDKGMLSGRRLPSIKDAQLDGVASGAIFGSSLYVNNARYFEFPGGDTEYWITKLAIRP